VARSATQPALLVSLGSSTCPDIRPGWRGGVTEPILTCCGLQGFETVTYVLQGGMKHRDSTGVKQFYGADSVQWMTAGASPPACVSRGLGNYTTLSGSHTIQRGAGDLLFPLPCQRYEGALAGAEAKGRRRTNVSRASPGGNQPCFITSCPPALREGLTRVGRARYGLGSIQLDQRRGWR
jgi:hypothetical protein